MKQTFTLSTADADFRADQRGARADAVFLHGFGGDLSLWDDVWNSPGLAFGALRYDLRGFGGSVSKTGGPFSHAEDLLAVLDSLDVAQCNLVGASMGGAIGINFALNFPSRVRKLVLISPGLVAWEWSEHWKSLWRSIVDCARNGEMDRARRLWWEHPLFATTRNSPAAGQLYQSIMRFAGDQWLHDEQRHELPDLERLHLLKAPTLLLTGGCDLEDFRLIADVLEASVPDLRRIDFPEFGHCLQLEDPAGVIAQMAPFLDG